MAPTSTPTKRSGPSLIGAALSGTITAGPIMLLLGMIHHEISSSVPALGFLPVWGMSVLVFVIASVFLVAVTGGQ